MGELELRLRIFKKKLPSDTEVFLIYTEKLTNVFLFKNLILICDNPPSHICSKKILHQILLCEKICSNFTDIWLNMELHMWFAKCIYMIFCI